MQDSIDWSQTWFRSVCAAHASIRDHVGGHTDWKDAATQRSELLDIQNEQRMQIRFAEQALLPNGTSYEVFIHDTGQVPTRDNLHDYFNALVWLSFPKIKR